MLHEQFTHLLSQVSGLTQEQFDSALSRRLASVSSLPHLRKLGWAQINVSQDAPECSCFQVSIAMNRDGGTPPVAFQEVVTATNAEKLESLGFQEENHLPAGEAREAGHTSLVKSQSS